MSAQRKFPVLAACLAMMGITVIALWARLHGLTDKSFWTDEGVSAALARLDWYNFLRILWRREANMTLYYLLLRVWIHVSDGMGWIRGLSVLWSVATVPVIFWLGRRLFSTWTGVSAALILTLNAYSVRYAQDARSYSLVAFLVTIAAYYFVKAIESGRKGDWKLYVLFSTLAFYAQFFSVLVLVSQVVIVGWKLPDKKAEFKSAAKWYGLFTLPLWIFILTTGAGPLKWVSHPDLYGSLAVFRDYAGNGGPWLAVWFAALMAVSVALAMRRREPWQYAFVFAWFAVPVAITLIVSVVRPVFVSRYLIVCLPAMILMVAAAITSFRRWFVAVPFLAVICWMSVIGLRSYYAHDFDIYREDNRSATAYILQHAQAGDIIAFHNGQNRFAFTYYAGHMTGTRPDIVYPGTNQPTWHDFFGKVTPPVLTTISQHHGRVWLYLSENLGPTGEDASSAMLKQTAGRTHDLMTERNFSYLKVYLYRAR